MVYKIKALETFDKQVKKLSKKYISIKQDLQDLIAQLKTNPYQGDALPKGCYKIRLKITSKGKGKSGGARVITYVLVSNEQVYLLTIYDKSEKEDISLKELKNLLKKLEEQ